MSDPDHHHPTAELQLDWDVGKLHEGGVWPTGPDNFFLMHRLSSVPTEVTALGGSGRVLEIAAAEAIHSCKLNLAGMECFVVEPSMAMLERARGRMKEYGAEVTLIRGVAETLPFPDGTFDRVLLDSAIDHLAQPQLSVREMTRVLKPEGRLVITFVNYGGLSVKLSRLIYGAGRFAGLLPKEDHLFWDTPVPIEHTFECTYPVLQRLCEPYLELDRAFGVSLGWMVPGWGPLLHRLPLERALGVMRGLDRLAERNPAAADFVVSVWQPRAGVSFDSPAAVAVNGSAVGGDGQVVTADDVVYPSRARAEADYWSRIEFGGFELIHGDDRQVNQAYTGDSECTWIDELIGRGPFAAAASLGCDEAGYERLWIEKGGSQRLDVYELSRGVIRKVRAGLGGARRKVKFIRADLNFALLPEQRYDVIWSSGCLHHVVNLEFLFAQVERSLRPGGLFAFRDYVGERRMHFEPQRLRRINQILSEVPAEFRRTDEIIPPRLDELSPFCAVRSDEVLGLAETRFDVVHIGHAGALFPLNLAIDLAAAERSAPELAQRIYAAEHRAVEEPDARPCGVYAVFRKRR